MNCPLPLIVTDDAVSDRLPCDSVTPRPVRLPANCTVSFVPNTDPLMAPLHVGTFAVEPWLIACSAKRKLQYADCRLSSVLSTVIVAACNPAAVSAIVMATTRFLARSEVEVIDWS